jgi:salicylate hydroxylase
MKISVIGAGISGLTLAAAMRQKAPDAEVTLFERDASASSRTQGYAIGLRSGMGLAALAEMGLHDAVVGKGSLRVTNLAITNQDGNELLSLRSSPNDPNMTYRVQRLHLKDVLLGAADEKRVRYGMRCLGFEQARGHVVAAFEDGSRVDADYLVACDGVGSAIRQQSVGDSKHFLGLVAIHAESPVEVEHPLLEGGYFLSLGENGCSFFCYRQPAGVYWSYVVHAESEAAVAEQSERDLLERVKRETDGWHELVHKVTSAARIDSVGVRGYYDKEPISHVHDRRVWMVGDAAHPMSPFQGLGANMALMDGVRLAQFLAADRGQGQLAAMLDADIVKRGRTAVLESRNNARRFHQTSALARFQRDQVFRMANLFIRVFRSRK